jgi:hypothetical protein
MDRHEGRGPYSTRSDGNFHPLDLLSLVGEGSVTRLRETNAISRTVHCFLREVIRTCSQTVSFITLYHGSNG